VQWRAFILVLLALPALLGCKDRKGRDPKAEIVDQTIAHIDKTGRMVAPLTKLSEVTPPYEVARALRVFAQDLRLWHREYVTLRAKMVARRVSRAQDAEVSKHYKAAVEDLRTRVDQMERRITKRGEQHFFFAELQRVRGLARDL
jgi:hypothetical protein